MNIRGEVRCDKQLGGMLNYYHRDAALIEGMAEFLGPTGLGFCLMLGRRLFPCPLHFKSILSPILHHKPTKKHSNR